MKRLSNRIITLVSGILPLKTTRFKPVDYRFCSRRATSSAFVRLLKAEMRK